MLDTRGGSDSSTCMELENTPFAPGAWFGDMFELAFATARVGLAGSEARVESVAVEAALEINRFAVLSCLAC